MDSPRVADPAIHNLPDRVYDQAGFLPMDRMPAFLRNDVLRSWDALEELLMLFQPDRSSHRSNIGVLRVG